MKKLFALLLVSAMLLTFAGCRKNDDVRGSIFVNSDVTSSTASVNSDTDDVSTDVSDSSSSSQPTASSNTPSQNSSVVSTPSSSTPSTTVSTPQNDDDGFSVGAVNGLTYKNRFIGIGCNLDSDWTFYSDAQIKQLNNVAADMAGDEYKEAMKNATVIYDMYAVSSNQQDNININLEKVNPVQLATLDIAENFTALLPLLKSSLENMGCQNITHENTTVKIGGKSFNCLKLTSDINGMKMYQTLIAKKCDGYLANITITAFDEATINNLIGKFYLI